MAKRTDNTSRPTVSKLGFVAATALLVVLLVSTVACAFPSDGWFNTTKLYTLRYDEYDMPVFDQSVWLELTPSYRAVSGGYLYEYLLDNSHTQETIYSFALTFSDVVNSNIPFTEFRPTTGWGHNDSAGWVEGIPQIFNNFSYGRELLWYAAPVANAGIAPGGSMVFSFVTTLDPGSHQDNKTSGMAVANSGIALARGYNGYTYGPGPQTSAVPAVPELPSTLLALPGLACVGAIRARWAGRRRVH